MEDYCSNYDENKKSYDYKNDFDKGKKDNLINCINTSIKNKLVNLNGKTDESNENLNKNTLKLYETNLFYVSFKIIIFLILFYYYYVLL